jgi:alpha-galactosidase
MQTRRLFTEAFMNRLRTLSLTTFAAIAATSVTAPALAAERRVAPAAAATAALAQTPPMGWNSWNKFQCNVSDTLIRSMADAVVTSGMKDAGYEYVVIDDCWQVKRNETGDIVPDPERFPQGMKALADYIHSKGLKFGLYSDAGTETCGGRPGSKGYEEQDARQYAAWGVDYLKYDWCKTEGMDARAAYRKMGQALANSGRQILLSMCEWGQSKPWLWAAGVGQMWRTTGDIQDCWDCSTSWGGMGVTHIIDLQEPLYPYAGPGHWNDPDMLEVGNGGMTSVEYRAHFSLWCLLAAPLIAGNDLAQMSAETRAILTNKEVIAIDQDPLGVQGRKVRDGGAIEVWMKPLAGGERALVLFNRGSVEAPIAFDWEDIGFAPDMTLAVRDLWEHKDLGTFTKRFEARVAPHGVVMLRARAQPAAAR